MKESECKNTQFERVWSTTDLANRYGFTLATIRKKFKNEPGVYRFLSVGGRTFLKIPDSVVQRVEARVSVPTA